MRLHSNSLTPRDVVGALIRSNPQAEVFFRVLSPHRSRSHERAFEVRLGATDDAPARDAYGKPRRHNHDGAPGKGATYAEWGWFIAAIFRADPSAKFGPYDGADDFYRKTNGEFPI